MKSINVERWKRMKKKFDELTSKQRKAQHEVGRLNHAIYKLSNEMGEVARRIYDEGSEKPWLAKETQ